MPDRTAIAAVSGLATGITLTVVSVEGITTGDLPGLLHQLAVRFLPPVIVTIVALSVMRRWNAAHEARNRRDIEVLAEQRRLLYDDFKRRQQAFQEREEGLHAREEALREREALVNRHSVISDTQRETLLAELAEARAGRAEAWVQLRQLQEDFSVLADEYNAMVLGEVDERVATFTRPRPPRQGGPRERRRERGQGSHGGTPTRLYVRAAEPDEHARPAEG